MRNERDDNAEHHGDDPDPSNDKTEVESIQQWKANLMPYKKCPSNSTRVSVVSSKQCIS